LKQKAANNSLLTKAGAFLFLPGLSANRFRHHSDRSGTLTLPEYVYATYNELMKNGWRMKEIDEMDMLGFLRLRAWDAQREAEKKKPRQRFIDEVWPGVKP